MTDSSSNRSIRIEESAIGSAIVSGDGNTIYIIQQSTEQRREKPATEHTSDIGPNPYKGLAAFKESDADLFFGREVQVERLWKRFQDLYEQSAVPRFLPILGPSGCGKSSLARAGLVPELARRPLPGKETIRVVVMLPGESPLKSLAGVLALLTRDDQTPEVIKKRSYEEELRKSAESDRFDFLQDVAETLPDIQAAPLVILVDQFEETYSLCKDFEESTAFIENLLCAAGNAKGYVTVIITLRSDFWSETQRHEQLNQIIGSDQSVNMPAMKVDELRRAIAEPARQAGRPLDEATVDLLVKDTEGREGALPLLQFALTQIWEGLIEGKVPTDIYREIGGVGGALADRAQKIYVSLEDERKRKIARRVFIGLVQLGEGTRDTRRRVRVDSLVSTGDSPEEVEQVIHEFSSPGSRLIALSNLNGHKTAEVTHEALFEHWQLLNSWLDSSRDDIRFQRRVEAASTYWDKQGKSEGLLWRSPDLDLLRIFIQEKAEELSQLSISFFEMSDKFEKRQKQLKHWSITGLSLLLLVMTGLAALSFVQFRDQKKQTINADILAKSLEIKNLLTSNLELEAVIASINLGNQVNNNQQLLNQPTKVRALSTLSQVIYGVGERNRLQDHISDALSVSFSPDSQTIISTSADKTVKLWDRKGELLKTLEDHSDYVWIANFSPDGETIVSASADKTIKLWDRKGNLLNTLQGHDGEVYDASFSPDGETIVSASADKTIKLWDRQGNLLNTLQSHNSSIFSASFSPDGETIVSASADKTIKLWDRRGNLLNTLQGHDGEVYDASFSPDGETIVSASADKTIKLWDRQGNLLNTLQGHDSWIFDVSFSPDGQTIASASADTTVKLWDLEGKLLNTLQGHGDVVWRVSFSPDGKIIAFACLDTTIKLWDLKNNLSNTLEGSKDKVKSVNFSPDSQTIASASTDTTVRLWDRQGNPLSTLEGHRDGVNSVSFSPDGQTIASASDDTTIKLWDRQGALLSTLEGHRDGVNSVSFSPDGQTIASASDDTTVKLWDRKGKLLNTLEDHEAPIFSVSFSPDGKIIASGSDDTTIKLWDYRGNLLTTIQGHFASVLNVSFSPNGKTIASASHDTLIKLWDYQGNLLNTLKGHGDGVNSVSFNSNGQLLFSASGDRTVKIWDSQGNLLNTLEGHSTWVNSVSFSPDSQTIASASHDGIIKLWELDLNKLLDKGCQWLQDYLATNPEVTAKERHFCIFFSNANKIMNQ